MDLWLYQLNENEHYPTRASSLENAKAVAEDLSDEKNILFIYDKENSCIKALKSPDLRRWINVEIPYKNVWVELERQLKR